jgi:uncharacterized membrane protein
MRRRASALDARRCARGERAVLDRVDRAVTLPTAGSRNSAAAAWVSLDLPRIAAYPVAVFVLLSAIFGTAIIAVAPPLRGPDETAHFLRAYGIAQGDIVPSTQDGAGRKGILLPVSLHREFSLFHAWQSINRGDDFDYRRVFDEYRKGPLDDEVVVAAHQRVFAAYGGSDGYSPAAYLPQAAAALLAHTLGLGFLETIYLMRLAGLAAITAVLAYAIALTPALKWTFVAIAMLPSALYGRAVINADAAAFAFSLVVVAMFLRAAAGAATPGAATRSIWLMLCALAKPPGLVFVLLEWMRPAPDGAQGRDAVRRRMWGKWRSVVIVTVPAVAAAVLWTAVSSADVAAWRLVEITGAAALEFDPAWKLRFMIAHPLAFPEAVLGLIVNKHVVEFWHQLIGVLGLFDTVLQPWVYAAIGVLLAGTFIAPLGLNACPGKSLPSGVDPRVGTGFPMRTCAKSRRACAFAAGVTALAYCLVVILIFYLIWTPVDADQVWGVQGRYFVPVLPLVAIAGAALLDCGPDIRITAMMAIAAAILSGAGSIEAILRTDWNF